MTEEEAKKKWCPLARTAFLEDSDSRGIAMAAINRDYFGRPNSACRCIASECMAWQRLRGDSQDGYCGAFEG